MKKSKVTKDTVQTTNAALEQDGKTELETFEMVPVEDKKVVFDSEAGIGFVEVGLSLTLKLARRYEMARVDVKVRKPCMPGTEEATYTEIRDFCAEKIRGQWRAIRQRSEGEVKVKGR